MKILKVSMAVLALVVLSATGPAQAAPDLGAGAGGGQEAFAAWMFMTSRDSGVFYFASAWRSVSPDGMDAEGAVGRGRCHAFRGKSFTMILCTASGRPQPVSLDEFQIDPLLRSGSLSFKAHGFKQRVQWTGMGDGPGAGETVSADDGYAGAGAGDARFARAKGTIFGKRIAGGAFPFAYLDMSAGAGAVVSPGVDLHRTVDPDGTFHLRYRVTIPRSERETRRASRAARRSW
jgi:hypothetical protein